jgi:hypothetical protein
MNGYLPSTDTFPQQFRDLRTIRALVRNQQQRDSSGRFGSGGGSEDDLEAEAEKRGMSPEELKKQLGIPSDKKPAKNRRRVHNQLAQLQDQADEEGIELDELLERMDLDEDDLIANRLPLPRPLPRRRSAFEGALNCACRSDNDELPIPSLTEILQNAKADGSNADAVGSPGFAPGSADAAAQYDYGRQPAGRASRQGSGTYVGVDRLRAGPPPLDQDEDDHQPDAIERGQDDMEEGADGEEALPLPDTMAHVLERRSVLEEGDWREASRGGGLPFMGSSSAPNGSVRKARSY